MKVKTRSQVLVLTICFVNMLLLSNCSKNVTQNPSIVSPETIAFNQSGLYPEGLAYDAFGKRFFVSSFTRGTIGVVSDNGTYTNFVNDDQLISTAGIFIDSTRNRLLVAIADPGVSAKTAAATQGKLAALAIYNLSIGQRTSYINLGSLKPLLRHFANDIAIDNLGNIYVTDSFSGIIYKIDSSGNASVFIEDARLAAPEGAFGLNGIVYHPNGYLIVAKYNDGLLFRIPVNSPTSLTQIAISQTIPSADGLLLVNNSTLTVACNNPTNKVFGITSNDNWSNANISSTFNTGDVFPTTLAKRDNEAYVLYAYLGALFSGQTPPITSFQIQKLKF